MHRGDIFMINYNYIYICFQKPSLSTQKYNLNNKMNVKILKFKDSEFCNYFMQGNYTKPQIAPYIIFKTSICKM